MTDSHSTDKPDGAAFDDYFESLGKKAEQLTGNQANPGAASTQLNASGADASDDEPKIVDEIESLCMNCHKNVSSTYHALIYEVC